jgi:hypothetical protein
MPSAASIPAITYLGLSIPKHPTSWFFCSISRILGLASLKLNLCFSVFQPYFPGRCKTEKLLFNGNRLNVHLNLL